MVKSIVFADDLPAATLAGRVRDGTLTRLARGIYSTEVDDAPADVVRRHWSDIVGRRFPGAVITDRSAVWAQPHDGFLFIASSRAATLSLPGLTVVSRQAPGPSAGDIALGAGLHLASRPRALLDNTRTTRRRNGSPAATLSRAELADWVDHLGAVDGMERLNSYRRAAEKLAPDLEIPLDRVKQLNDLVGTTFGTRNSASGSHALQARSLGTPYDQTRVRRFELLADHLRDIMTTHPALPEDESRRATLPFWEAYFSNFIEGTKFTPGEAERIVREGIVPDARPADAHDVLGTYRLVSDDAELQQVPASAEEFLDRLRSRHRVILAGRPEKHPGAFKQTANQAGNTAFVAPDLVEGTLRQGFEILRTLATPTQRGAFAAFLIAEVHPFDDGNGRLARIAMNAEYVAGGEQRAIVPIIARNDYLRALRRLSRQDRPDLFVAFLDRVRRWTAQMDWSTFDTAYALLDATNAFVDATDAEDRGLHLLDPGD